MRGQTVVQIQRSDHHQLKSASTHLGPDFDVLKWRVDHALDDGVCDISDAALQGQEAGRQTALADLTHACELKLSHQIPSCKEMSAVSITSRLKNSMMKLAIFVVSSTPASSPE